MGTYVLVHGSWHGGWCWNKVAALLARSGHVVFAPDLAGHGKDHTPISKITLQTYVDLICRIIDSQKESVRLVGHSRGGIVISQAAELRPSKVEKLIYLAAFIVRNGETMIEWAKQDTDCLLLPNLAFSDDRSYHFIKNKTLIKDIFYGDCTDTDAEWAKSQLVPEPTAPIETTLQLTEGKYGRVRRCYIETRNDKAVSPMLQRKMYSSAGCDSVVTINASHSPFLSQPSQLAKILEQT